jgi:hypothetical protein
LLGCEKPFNELKINIEKKIFVFIGYHFKFFYFPKSFIAHKINAFERESQDLFRIFINYFVNNKFIHIT